MRLRSVKKFVTELWRRRDLSGEEAENYSYSGSQSEPEYLGAGPKSDTSNIGSRGHWNFRLLDFQPAISHTGAFLLGMSIVNLWLGDSQKGNLNMKIGQGELVFSLRAAKDSLRTKGWLIALRRDSKSQCLVQKESVEFRADRGRARVTANFVQISKLLKGVLSKELADYEVTDAPQSQALIPCELPRKIVYVAD